MGMAREFGSRMWSAAALMLAAVFAAPALSAAGDVETDQDSVLAMLGNIMFWEYVTFGIVLIVLGKFVLPKLLSQLAARQDRITDALDKADQVRSEAEVLLKKHEEMMKRAHEDAKKITDDATAAAREAAAKIATQAETIAKETRERQERDMELMVKKARAELRELAVELALAASSKVLEKSLEDEDHRKLAREAIDAAGSIN